MVRRAVNDPPYEPYDLYAAEVGFTLGYISQLNGVRGKKKRNPIGFAAPKRASRKKAGRPPGSWPDVPWLSP